MAIKTVDLGNVIGPQGPQGPKGDAGAAGAAGKSAYQAAVDGGYTGTQTQFNEQLKKMGDPGYAPVVSPVFAGSISMGRKEGTQQGDKSIAVGFDCEASDEYCYAMGDECVASEPCCHAEGYMCTASTYYSHAEGNSSKATGEASHAEGYRSEASNIASHAGGKYNKAMITGGSYGNQTGDVFVLGNGTGASSRSNAFRVTYAGTVYGKGSFQTSGADYAEYFQWTDDNPDNEDRVGYFVTLEGAKIKLAQPGDYVLGVVSANPCIIGNADEDWLGRRLHDQFGRFIKEYLVDDEVVDYETSSWRYKENPDYDPDQPYIERKDRAEWDAIGMLGVLAVRDDGTCQTDGFCQVAEGGVATAAEVYVPGLTWRVIERVNEGVVKVVFR